MVYHDEQGREWTFLSENGGVEKWRVRIQRSRPLIVPSRYERIKLKQEGATRGGEVFAVYFVPPIRRTGTVELINAFAATD